MLPSDFLQRVGKSQSNFLIEEPHSGITTQVKVKPLDLTAKKSAKNRNLSLEMIQGSFKAVEKDLSLISNHFSDSKNIKNLVLPGDDVIPHEPSDLKFDTPLH